ncbi:MAG: hypothetical protein AUH15_03160 [Acidobacteriales bacterium 13_2_20CM_55_8]|nr:MAG: hypothetical protein AUH15_03160 [Acidobacteriales bacterium 13_2_20CM_55_8]
MAEVGDEATGLQKEKNMRLRFWFALLCSTLAFAKGPQRPSNLPVTTAFANTDASDTIADIQSDALGSYFDGVDAVTSFLTTNGYNGIVWGDWQFGTLNSATRKVSLSFANPIQLANGGTAIPNPPFTTKNVTAHIEVKCTMFGLSMLTMSANQTFQCPLIVHFFDTNSYEYRIYMAPNWTQPPTPETSYAQVSCNAVAADNSGCNDWYIDPIPGYDTAGNRIPGAATGRLVFFGCSACRGNTKVTGDANEGDYSFRFHFHVTRP